MYTVWGTLSSIPLYLKTSSSKTFYLFMGAFTTFIFKLSFKKIYISFLLEELSDATEERGSKSCLGSCYRNAPSGTNCRAKCGYNNPNPVAEERWGDYMTQSCLDRCYRNYGTQRNCRAECGYEEYVGPGTDNCCWKPKIYIEQTSIPLFSEINTKYIEFKIENLFLMFVYVRTFGILRQ